MPARPKGMRSSSTVFSLFTRVGRCRLERGVGRNPSGEKTKVITGEISRFNNLDREYTKSLT